MTTDDLLILAGVVLAIVAVVAFLTIKKKTRRAALTASTCGNKAYPGGTMNPSAWFIGPDLKVHGNKSVGMPEHPLKHQNGFYFDIPHPTAAQGHVHYVTFNHGPLTGKKLMRMRYRIEGAPEMRILPRTVPELPSLLTLYFQREGDDWTASQEFETYRWYATFATVQYLTAGEGEIVAPLDANWTATMHSSHGTNPAAFRDAINNACCVGFVLGGGDGYGHGVFADGPARFIVTEFAVE